MTIKFEVKGRDCLIDDEDSDLLTDVWYMAEKRGVAYLYKSLYHGDEQSNMRMHRIIMARVLGRELERLELIDHEDLNGLNNTRKNLRIASNSQNLANRGAQANNKLGLKGVSRKGDKYRAQISINGKPKHLGLFYSPQDAHAAYLTAAKELFGEFARGE